MSDSSESESSQFRCPLEDTGHGNTVSDMLGSQVPDRPDPARLTRPDETTKSYFIKNRNQACLDVLSRIQNI